MVQRSSYIYNEVAILNFPSKVVNNKVAEIKGYHANGIEFNYKFNIDDFDIPEFEGESVYVNLISKNVWANETLRNLFKNE